jgi:hypothetical protein
MNTVHRSFRIAALWLALATTLSGCAVTAGGYDEDVGVSYGVGFYEPWGYGYNGWHEGYRVGPPRGGERHGDGDHRAYRPAHPSRPTPSIPTRSRGHH